MITRALLLLVHGSPLAASNEQVFRVAEELRRRKVYPIVEVGFLECNVPSIPEAVKLCVTQGAEHIAAVPYFLHTGSHVAEDLPAVLEQAASDHPGVEIRMSRFLGSSPHITAILSDRARDTA
jgi:sirohydrochlorin cobaltochelatase